MPMPVGSLAYHYTAYAPPAPMQAPVPAYMGAPSPTVQRVYPPQGLVQPRTAVRRVVTPLANQPLPSAPCSMPILARVPQWQMVAAFSPLETQARPSTENFECFVAFNQADAEAIDRSGFLDPKLLGMTHVPLQKECGAAIQMALQSKTITALQAATDTTNWHVLKLSLPSEYISKAFLEGYLHWSWDMKNMEWWGRIHVRGESAPGLLLTTEWIQHELSALGLDAWANNVLGLATNETGTCAGCQEESVPVWHSRQRGDEGEYCAKCWNSFLKECSFGSLHDKEQSLAEERASPSTSRDEAASAPVKEGTLSQAQTQAQAFLGGA
eukprot:TRINITY_DN102114_c0_g1_i1.p1 TRINITY_DN102114_c0_g1~~TRINITY_DN102114_c0_g1_i1.p1  ORF type:complete len:355 (-),score=55.96 TRINITY_DN102114_c0_g1_i1:56-1033(-)